MRKNLISDDTSDEEEEEQQQHQANIEAKQQTMQKRRSQVNRKPSTPTIKLNLSSLPTASKSNASSTRKESKKIPKQSQSSNRSASKNTRKRRRKEEESDQEEEESEISDLGDFDEEEKYAEEEEEEADDEIMSEEDSELDDELEEESEIEQVKPKPKPANSRTIPTKAARSSNTTTSKIKTSMTPRTAALARRAIVPRDTFDPESRDTLDLEVDEREERQSSMLSGFDSSESEIEPLQTMPMSEAGETAVKDIPVDLIREELIRKRRAFREQKEEDIKNETIQKLLKKQAKSTNKPTAKEVVQAKKEEIFAGIRYIQNNLSSIMIMTEPILPPPTPPPSQLLHSKCSICKINPRKYASKNGVALCSLQCYQKA